MGKHIKVAAGLIGFVLAFMIWSGVWITILHELGVNNHHAEVPIVLLITSLVFFVSMPRLGAFMDELEQTAPEWWTVIGWFRKQA